DVELHVRDEVDLFLMCYNVRKDLIDIQKEMGDVNE
ncbi:unnamed protein product, partial [marine sediment metagenome]